MSTITCNLNELLEAVAFSDAQSKHLHAHVAQDSGRLAYTVVGFAVSYQQKDLTIVAPCEKISSCKGESQSSFGSTAREFHLFDAP